MKKFLAITLLIMGWVQGATAQSETPLMVLRYNQPRIYYDKQLYNVVKKAVAIKPEVAFSVVSFVPKATSENVQDSLDNAARQHLNKFVADLRAMGIPQERINITNDYAPDARFHELYLYVD